MMTTMILGFKLSRMGIVFTLDEYSIHIITSSIKIFLLGILLVLLLLLLLLLYLMLLPVLDSFYTAIFRWNESYQCAWL